MLLCTCRSIVECSKPPAAKEAAVEAGDAAWQELSSTLEKLGSGSAAEALSVVRRLRATRARDHFYKEIAPLREQLMVERKQIAAETAATKVDFYTMVRGEG